MFRLALASSVSTRLYYGEQTNRIKANGYNRQFAAGHHNSWYTGTMFTDLTVCVLAGGLSVAFFMAVHAVARRPLPGFGWIVALWLLVSIFCYVLVWLGIFSPQYYLQGEGLA